MSNNLRLLLVSLILFYGCKHTTVNIKNKKILISDFNQNISKVDLEKLGYTLKFDTIQNEFIRISIAGASVHARIQAKRAKNKKTL